MLDIHCIFLICIIVKNSTIEYIKTVNLQGILQKVKYRDKILKTTVKEFSSELEIKKSTFISFLVPIKRFDSLHVELKKAPKSQSYSMGKTIP